MSEYGGSAETDNKIEFIKQCEAAPIETFTEWNAYRIALAELAFGMMERSE